MKLKNPFQTTKFIVFRRRFVLALKISFVAMIRAAAKVRPLRRSMIKMRQRHGRGVQELGVVPDN